MYLKYWGLTKPPFESVPNRELFFHSPQHEEALVRLIYAIEHKKGAAMLTGEVGSGKTTVSQVLMKNLPKEKFDVKTIINPALDPLDFIRAIIMQTGVNSNGDSKVVLLKRLYDYLVKNIQMGISTVLVIDEAHLIKEKASLEELRMLLNMQLDNRFLITLILIGQPPLEENIAALKPLKERIAIKYNLDALSIRDAIRYILFRLKNAGARRGIITRKAADKIFFYSKGIPLRINNLCDRCFLVGMMKNARVIDTSIVKSAIEDLR